MVIEIENWKPPFLDNLPNFVLLELNKKSYPTAYLEFTLFLDNLFDYCNTRTEEIGLSEYS